MWKSEDFAEARADFGEEFSDEIYNKWMNATIFSDKLINVQPNGENIFSIDNTILENNSGIKALNKLCGLNWKNPDTKAIAAVNYKRFEKMDYGIKPELTGKQMVWMAGYPGAGKTFLGDYLATKGWAHIDGDQGNYNENAEIMPHFMKLWEAMQAKIKG